MTSVSENLVDILQLIEEAKSRRKGSEQDVNVRLVAVTKTKPKELVIEAYKAGQRCFGENYVQELHEKANDAEVLRECPDIKWHFIGHVQGNKIGKLLAVPNLDVVETVDSLSHAKAIDQTWGRTQGDQRKLNVFLQVNTSGEKGTAKAAKGDGKSQAKRRK